MKKFLSVLIPISSVSLSAEPIVSGHVAMGCSTENHTMGTPSEESALPTSHSLPARCADYSGEWRGGCFGPGSAYPTHWPTHNNYVVLVPLGPDSSVTAAPVKGVDILKDTPQAAATLKISQEGCRRLTLDWNRHVRTISFEGRTRLTQTEGFRRSCHSGQHKWRRTYAFRHERLRAPLWRSEGSWFRENERQEGKDAHYGATFLRTVNRDFRLSADLLRVDATVYVKASHFDPAPFDWSPPSVGAEICVFRRHTP